MKTQQETYPIKIKLSAKALEEFKLSEYPSYEDYIEGRLDESIINIHQYEVLSKYKSQLVIKNNEELCRIWYALCSGTFQMLRRRSAKILADKLKPIVEKEIPSILEEWSYPDFN